MTTWRVELREVRGGYITFSALWKKLKVVLEEGTAVHGEFTDGKTREQERLCHSCYRDLAKHALLGGKKATAAKWKVSMKTAFWLATKDDQDFADDWHGRAPEEVPLPDGNGYVMEPVESKRFNRRLYSALITFIHQTGDAREVPWSKTSLGRDAPIYPTNL